MATANISNTRLCDPPSWVGFRLDIPWTTGCISSIKHRPPNTPLFLPAPDLPFGHTLSTHWIAQAPSRNARLHDTAVALQVHRCWYGAEELLSGHWPNYRLIIPSRCWQGFSSGFVMVERDCLDRSGIGALHISRYGRSRQCGDAYDICRSWPRLAWVNSS